MSKEGFEPSTTKVGIWYSIHWVTCSSMFINYNTILKDIFTSKRKNHNLSKDNTYYKVIYSCRYFWLIKKDISALDNSLPKYNAWIIEIDLIILCKLSKCNKIFTFLLLKQIGYLQVIILLQQYNSIFWLLVTRTKK